jgi:PAS domain S-box-containing protein
MSHSLTEVLGYLPEEIYEMEPEAIKDLLHPEDREKSNMIIARLITPEPGKEVKRVIDYRIRHKNGSFRWFSDKYTVLFDDKGMPEYISGNIIDITKFKDAEDLLRSVAPDEKNEIR